MKIAYLHARYHVQQTGKWLTQHDPEPHLKLLQVEVNIVA